MNTRLGFVSNSSSSSCLVLGRLVGKLREVERLDPEKRYVARTGYWLCEGEDLIELNQEMLDYIHRRWADQDGIVIEVDNLLDFGAEEWAPTVLPRIKAGTQAWIVDRDCAYTNRLTLMNERYTPSTWEYKEE